MLQVGMENPCAIGWCAVLLLLNHFPPIKIYRWIVRV